MKRRAPLAILTLLVLWSCSDSSLLLGEVEEQAQLEVSTLPSGSVLGPGAEVPIRIERDPVYTGDETTADRLVVELYDYADTLLAEQSYDSVDQAAELPPIALPDLPEGLYRLETSYYDGDVLVVREASSFFIVTGSYRIVGLTAYPASSYPEADGLLRLSLEIPAEADPFLVWRLSDRTIASGYLSETGTTIAVLAPASQGVFPVEVELYPVWPEGADPSLVEPATTYSADLYVSNSPTPARTDLLPEQSYFALYHLRGSLRDDGVRGEWFPSREFAAQPFGAPGLAAAPGIFGYRLDGRSGFTLDGAVWPVYDGELSPVSFTFRLLPEELAERATLLDISLRSSRLAGILVDDEGRLGLSLPLTGVEVWTPVPVLSRGSVELVTVSVVPGGDRTTVLFFAGGELIFSTEVAGISLEEAGMPRTISGADRWAMLDGTTTIGSQAGGFSGIVDEFGIFFRDEENRPAVNTTVFRDSMRTEYGERLLYAASFEDPEEVAALSIDEPFEIDAGALIVPPGTRAAFPFFRFADEDLIVELEMTLETLARFELTPEGDDAQPIAQIDLVPDEESSRVRLTLIHRDGTLTIVRGEDERVVETAGEFYGVTLSLTVPDPAEPETADENETETEHQPARVQVRSIVARRDRPRIPERLFEVDGE
ncbi:MAG: hypothetical protein ACOC1U_05915 [Spirochaetota bacterium]